MKPIQHFQNERGLALVVALMLLVLLTVMGLAAITATTTELQITSNERTDAQSFHAAEAGIKEVLYRETLPSVGANSIANGGSWATVDGVSFDAVIKDPLVGGNPDPNWKYSIYFSTPPAGTNNVRSIITAADQKKLDYSSSAAPVTVRYEKESDLMAMGVADYDLNHDGDTMDLVYFNGNLTTPQRVGAGTKVNGTADVAPPAGGNTNLAVRLVTSVGRSGKATKQILLETTGFPVNPQANSALQIDAPITLTGNGFISGYNHSEDTKKSDSTLYNQTLYNSNKCDNYSKGTGTGGCGMASDPDVGLNAPYSGKASTTDQRPAVLSNDATDINTAGSFEGWGGTDDNTAGWKKVDAALTFPSLATLLGVDQTVVDSMLANANTSSSSCPSGVTYIDNKQSGQVYMPSQNCPSGSGVLIVKGDMKVTSQFEFRGLIYVEGDLDMRGGSWFLGAAVVKGKAAGNTLGAGGATILYSKNTVVNAVTAAMTQAGSAFTTLSWREN